MKKRTHHKPALSAKPQSCLGQILDKVDSLQQLQGIVRDNLPTELASHCQVANYENQRLSIAVDNATWATQLRFLLPDVQKKLQSCGKLKGLKTVNCFVLPAETSAKQARQARALSTKTQLILTQLAKTITHPRLKRSLEKLIKIGAPVKPEDDNRGREWQ